ncbi:MAG: S1 RNA-binding domain-containing protein, partial [Microvirga sp.]
EIVEKTGAKINIEDDGTVKIASSNAKEIEAAKKWIHTIVAEPEVGEIYEGTVDKIREVIGSGGKVIREIVEKTGAKINIEDDGTVRIASASGKEIEAAKKWIHSIVAEPEVGEIYEGTVVKCVDFGAFVNFFGSRDGLVHISQLANGRVAKTQDVVTEGQKVWVKLMGFDERGKVRLSMKVVDQETGEDLTEKLKAEREAERNRERRSEPVGE